MMSPSELGLRMRIFKAVAAPRAHDTEVHSMNRENAPVRTTLPPHEPRERSRPKNSPSPLPSPAGRGRIVHRWLETTNDGIGSGVQCANLPSGKSHPGPLPLGEGELFADSWIDWMVIAA